MNHRHVITGQPVGEPHIARLRLFGGGHHLNNAGQKTGVIGGGHLDHQRR